MSGLTTSYEFTLPRGYLDRNGQLHRTGRMRLATARDELEPLRDPRVTGPEDPQLTIFVLTRVIEQLGTLEMVTSADVEGLFAVDLAYLQDFYGVINFGSQEEYDALLRAQLENTLVGDVPARASSPEAAPDDGDPVHAGRAGLRAAVEELPRRAQ